MKKSIALSLTVLSSAFLFQLAECQVTGNQKTVEGAPDHMSDIQTGEMSAMGTYNIPDFADFLYVTGVSKDCTSKTAENQISMICTPVYSEGCISGDGFTFFDIDNQYSNLSGCDDNTGHPGWSAYPEMNANLIEFMSYDCTIISGNSDQYFTMWIDFNDDLVLNDNEKVIDCANIPTAGVPTVYSLFIPAGAAPGQHLLRVRAERQISCPHGPCEEMVFGETEDYSVTILAANSGTLEGYVYKYGGFTPIAGASVDILGLTGTTDADGYYSISGIPAGTWNATASHPDYSPQTVYGVVIMENQTNSQNFELTWAQISISPDPSVGITIYLPENQIQGSSISIVNTGNSDLILTFDFTDTSGGNGESDHGWKKDNEVNPANLPGAENPGNFPLPDPGSVMFSRRNVTDQDTILWCSLYLYSGYCAIIAPGEMIDIPFNVYSMGMVQGTVKTGIFTIASNAQNNGLIEMDIVMIVGGNNPCYAEGFVYEYNTMAPVSGCMVTIDGGIMPPISTFTDNEGHYEFSGLPGGFYEVSVSAASPCCGDEAGFWIDTLTVPIDLYIKCPEIATTPQEMNVQIPEGELKEDGLLVYNPGSYELQYTAEINFIMEIPGSVNAVLYHEHDNTGSIVQIGNSESWLSITENSSGTVPPFSQTLVQMGLLFDATGFPAGTVKTAEIVINSSALTNPVLTVPVSMSFCESRELDLKVFLEGAFNTDSGIMDTILNNNGLIPFTQPFNPELPYYGNFSPAWYYQGDESVTGIGNGVVDWLLIEIRDAANVQGATAETKVLETPAFLLSDGSVVSLDFINKPVVLVNITQGMFIVLHHRNHLSIINSTPIPGQNGQYAFDYTGGGIYGGDLGAVEVLPGVWAMRGGDGNADFQVNMQDKVDAWWNEGGFSGYLGSDFNMDGQTGNQDKLDVWQSNSGQSSQVPQ